MILKFRICFILSLLAVFLPVSFAIRLSGRVVSESNIAIEGAVVRLYLRDSLQTRTDASGYFELTENSLSAIVHPKGFAINSNGFSIMGIGSEILTLPAGFGYDFKGGRVAVNKAANLLIIYAESGKHQQQTAVPAAAKIGNFNDILTVTAQGRQPLRRAVPNAEEDNIEIKLMPEGVNYVTAGIPIFSEAGGSGDVTTYGSVSDPEPSQGGACNYGTTDIRSYAAINVNQLPGDGLGQWNSGKSCGRCARVRIRTSQGEERTTVVRIMDKCADDNCGIDLGGAPAKEIMGDRPGRYSGEWEWVSCDENEAVSDGPPSLAVKVGGNEFWSLVQIRNGPGAVLEIRVRKAAGGTWLNMAWAEEAENFFKVPLEMLQDDSIWELEVKWDNGKTGTLLLAGQKLAVEDSVFQLQLLR